MILLILIGDDWKLTSLLEQVSATRVAFWTLLTGESWLAKPPVITMVLMMMTITMMIWFQTTTMLLPERRIILWRRWFVHHWRATASLSLNENDQLPLLDTFGHVARQSVDGLSWWLSWCRWLFMELIMVIAMILLLQTFRNVPSQSSGDFDEDCHQNDYYHDLLWCSWQCNDDINEKTVCLSIDHDISWLVLTGFDPNSLNNDISGKMFIKGWFLTSTRRPRRSSIQWLQERSGTWVINVRIFCFALHRHNHHLLSLCVFILSFFLRLKAMQLKHPNKSIFQLVAEKLGESNLLKLKILVIILSLLCSK